MRFKAYHLNIFGREQAGALAWPIDVADDMGRRFAGNICAGRADWKSLEVGG